MYRNFICNPHAFALALAVAKGRTKMVPHFALSHSCVQEGYSINSLLVVVVVVVLVLQLLCVTLLLHSRTKRKCEDIRD